MDTLSEASQTVSKMVTDPPDMVFLDIQMPGLNGFEVLERLESPPLIIFCTAYDEYALKAYELDVMDYLLKPIPFERFIKAVEKVYARFLKEKVQHTRSAVDIESDNTQKKAPDFTFIKSGNKTIKVYFHKILYIEGMRDYLQIHTEDSKIMTLLNFKTIQELLDQKNSLIFPFLCNAFHPL